MDSGRYERLFVGKIGGRGTGSMFKLNLKNELCELFLKKFLLFGRATYAP